MPNFPYTSKKKDKIKAKGSIPSLPNASKSNSSSTVLSPGVGVSAASAGNDEQNERTEKRKDDLIETGLSAVAVTLKVINDAAEFTPVPMLKNVASLALTLVELVQSAKESNDQYKQLALDAAQFVGSISRSYQGSSHKEVWPSVRLREVIDDLVKTLTEIKAFVDKKTKRSTVNKVFSSTADIGRIKKYRESINTAVKNFEIVLGLETNELTHQVHRNQQALGNSKSLKELSAHVAHAALYNSAARFDAPRCHRETRRSYLQNLQRWMLGPAEESGSDSEESDSDNEEAVSASEDSASDSDEFASDSDEFASADEDYKGARLIWLTGGAGVGKSAIMQSIVERTAQRSVVLGTFFFSRTDSSRNYAEVLIPTLAYQLASAFPAAMTVLDPILDRNPLIFKASLQTQAKELLVRPLQHLISAGIIAATSACRLVFVVDGLDECQDPKKQALIVQVIANILSDHNLPVSFLVASRPEVAISQAIQGEKRIHSMLATITLDNTPEATSDIRQYIEDSFLDIRETHPLREHIPENWPPPRSVEGLVQQSSGHFIFAATVMKFILSGKEHPDRALEVIEGLRASRTGQPFAELDALYTHIITSATYSSQVLRILTHCHCDNLKKTVTSVCFMNPDYSPEDVLLYLCDVPALVSLSPDRKAEMCISLKHASLSDFLGDETRSVSLYMHPNDYLASCLPRYFDMLGIDPKIAARQLQSAHNELLFYISRPWTAAIRNFPDGNLLHQLITRHSPREVWNVALDCAPLFQSNNEDVINFVSDYLDAIRHSVSGMRDNNALYAQQFGMFVELLVAEIRFTHPQYRLIPALWLSSTPACLRQNFPTNLMDHLQKLGLSVSCGYCFINHRDDRDLEQLSDFWHLHKDRLLCGTDLAFMLKPVLQCLVGNPWVPEHFSAHQHGEWLQKIGQVRSQSTGTPTLARALSTRLFIGLSSPASRRYISGHAKARLRRAGYSYDAAENIEERRYDCYILMKAVVYYLPKSHCTSEIAALARRPLPREGELWFPRLARATRKFMDAYVQHWETSYEGVIEKTQSMAVNDLD